MNRRIVILAVLIMAAGLLAYATTRVLLNKSAAPLSSHEDRLTWLTKEFKLGPEQTAAVDRLQAAYAPLCEAHCAAITRAQSTLSHAPDQAARSAARAELARLEDVCAQSTRAHLHAVAALMERAQAARFLTLMEPRVAHTTGRFGAPALDDAP